MLKTHEPLPDQFLLPLDSLSRIVNASHGAALISHRGSRNRHGRLRAGLDLSNFIDPHGPMPIRELSHRKESDQ